MASSAASRFSISVALHAALIGALVFVAFLAVFRAQYYATALILVALAVLVTINLFRIARAADRLYADFVTALAASAFDQPTTQALHFPILADALRRAGDRLKLDRQVPARRIQELEALLDTLSAVMFAVRENGELCLANRAARMLVGEETKRLTDIAVIGPTTAARLLQLPIGTREIVRLADGRRMLIAIALFRGSDDMPLRLISLQGLSSELSAVETRAWQDLVRVLSHEITNSLTPVVSLSESLQAMLAASDQPISEDARVAADVIGRRSIGLMTFVERYRRVAELPEPQPKPIAIADLLRDIDPLIESYSGGRALAYRSLVEPADLVARVDPDLLQQALINLIKNAAEAVVTVPNPQVELRCFAAEQQLVIEVQDNGVGMPESDLEQIFTPFFTTKMSSSGIGLALARQIAVAHGGCLAAQRLPTGALFRFSVPFRSADH